MAGEDLDHRHEPQCGTQLKVREEQRDRIERIRDDGANGQSRSQRRQPEIQLGIITCLIGGPFFLYLLLREREAP